MAGHAMKFTVWLACMVVVLFTVIEVSQANYKNAPMNGIMFGKRVPSGKTILFNR